jgi:ribosomal protein S18 acetylase RimI-like enzyme
MVDPGHRRRGIATRLLDAALELCDREGMSHRLLLVPRPSVAGTALAQGRGGELEHSEASMVLDAAPRSAPEDPRTTLRRAGEADAPELMRILTDGFGPPPDSLLRRLHDPASETLMIEHAGQPVGTIRLSLRDGAGAIHGFVVDSAHRGRGIGRDVLRRACVQLREQGAARVGLEVAVENDRALRLYTAAGFVPTETQDYYRLP